MLEIGSVIDGKYKILNKVGQGGMSVVYLAMNERANKQWAIKEIRKDGTSDYEVVKQGLIAETDILKRLNHPNLPSIIDVIDRDDTFLIVMDYIEGNPLSDAIEHYGAQNQEDVIEWAKELCDVLGYLHSRQPAIIYRDMKPSNVMLKPDGKVTLIDFGTARTFKETSVEDTKCLGTQGYAAPEQYGGHGQTDARTDIYCLGATLYHLVTGHNPCLPPYEMYPIRYWNPELSSGFEQIILKCTQRNPADRYQSCAELLYDLEHYNELDIEYKRAENKKWRLFLASGILTLFMTAAAVGFRSAANVATSNSYDGYVMAAASEDFEQAMQYFKRSISLKPSDATAYESLLEYVTRDGVITGSEDESMRSIFNETNGTTRSNIEYFRLNNAQAYEEFSYEIGNAYFYTYEGTDKREKSRKWFEVARESENLDEKKVARAKCLGEIASYSSKLDQRNETGDASTTYSEYWEDMTSLISSDTVALDNRITQMRSYKDFLFNVYTSMDKFKDAGITERAITQQLTMIEQAMEAVHIDSTNLVEVKLEQDIVDYTKQTKDTMKALYHGTNTASKEDEP